MGRVYAFIGTTLFFLTASLPSAFGQFPESLSIQIVYRECNPPKETGDKNTPFENVRSCVFHGKLNTNIARATTDKAGATKIKPDVTYSIGEEERKIELGWMEARAFTAYLARFNTEKQVTFVEMEDGTWNRGISLGIHFDLMTEKLTVPFRILEILRDHSGKGHVEGGLIEIPLSEIADRVFSKPTELLVTTDISEQHFFVNYNLDQVIPIIVLGFEKTFPAPGSLGPLTHLLPGFKNGNHSALVAIRSELSDPQNKSVRLYRMPVGLLRTVPFAKLKATYATQLDREASVRWLSELNVGAIAVPEAPEARIEVLRKYVDAKHNLSMSFDMGPADGCRALIVRENG